jgi:TPR repeat protein
MRRDNLVLLSAARSGDFNARREVGRRYLLGFGGFQRHVQTGIEYLRPQGVSHLEEAATVISDALSLKDILHFRQEDMLQRAAAAGSPSAQVKLAARLCSESGGLDDGIRWFERAAAGGHPMARTALQALSRPLNAVGIVAALRAACPGGDDDALAVALVAARAALSAAQVQQLALCLRAALVLSKGPTPESAELVVAALQLAEKLRVPDLGIDASALQACLELRMNQGDVHAAYALGRALCGIACGALPADSLVPGRNMRRGLGALLRAADGGCSDAWLCLYRISAAHETSVSNPHAARFYLERAAQAGEREAQRKLGILRMREVTCLDDAEAAMTLMHQAAMKGDPHARALLETFVLPVQGSDEEARAIVAEVRRLDSCLALRLELSRAFGLTRLEALTVDPALALRPWGLAVGPNCYVTQAGRGAARAVPALTEAAVVASKSAASFFGQNAHAVRNEGDLRRRSTVQRRCFKRNGFDAALFFSSVPSSMLAKLRQGSKWAYHVRSQLRDALAD